MNGNSDEQREERRSAVSEDTNWQMIEMVSSRVCAVCAAARCVSERMSREEEEREEEMERSEKRAE